MRMVNFRDYGLCEVFYSVTFELSSNMVIRGQEHSWLDSILGNQAQNSGYVKVTFTCLETFGTED
jgi:hypothetical protein